MSIFKYKVKAISGFHDGNVFPRRIHVGETVEVDEQTYLKMLQSDPDSIKLIEQLVPNPKKQRAAANA